MSERIRREEITVSILIDDKLAGEVPANFRRNDSNLSEISIDWTRVRTVDIILREHVSSIHSSRKTEALDLLIAAWLLGAKLVAGKYEYFHSLHLGNLGQQSIATRSVPISARNIDTIENFSYSIQGE